MKSRRVPGAPGRAWRVVAGASPPVKGPRRFATASPTEGRSATSALRFPMMNLRGKPLVWPSSMAASH
eukprot:11192594-Lingulodinium_polyedra.AAC.1